MTSGYMLPGVDNVILILDWLSSQSFSCLSLSTLIDSRRLQDELSDLGLLSIRDKILKL